MSVAPPKNKKELLDRVLEIIRQGPYELPPKGFGGAGGPGLYLESMLGLTTGNKDIPDSLGWEIKFYSPQTNYITLFHKEPQPRGIVRYMVSQHGWKDEQGRLSFRHTIAGKSDRFRVEGDTGRITVRPLKGNGPVPYWTEDDILGSAGAKLRRLLLVRGEKQGNSVSFERADAFENLGLSYFIYEVVRGTVLIDFDAREKEPGSDALRNHGTKFRVAPENVCRLYSKKDRVS